MLSSRARQSLLVAAVVLAAVPAIFGVIRAITTGDDVRYLWLAGSAMLGSLAIMVLGRAAGSARVSPGRAVGAVVAGAACAAATAIVLGAKAGPGVAIVALAFGLCTGTSAVLGTIARRRRTL
jgi:hypothetical protein